MSEPSPELQTAQIADILRSFLLLKSLVSVVVPEDVARLKDRLHELHPEGGPRRAADYELFYHVGVFLARCIEPPTMRELSLELRVPKNTATRMVDWMVENGYVQRLPDPEDRRVVRVALTDTGKELYQTINEFLRRRIEHMLSRLTAVERAQFVSLLRKVAATGVAEG